MTILISCIMFNKVSAQLFSNTTMDRIQLSRINALVKELQKMI